MKKVVASHESAGNQNRPGTCQTTLLVTVTFERRVTCRSPGRHWNIAFSLYGCGRIDGHFFYSLVLLLLLSVITPASQPALVADTPQQLAQYWDTLLPAWGPEARRGESRENRAGDWSDCHCHFEPKDVSIESKATAMMKMRCPAVRTAGRPHLVRLASHCPFPIASASANQEVT